MLVSSTSHAHWAIHLHPAEGWSLLANFGIKWYLYNESWWQEIIDGEYQDYYERMYSGRLEPR